MIFELSGILGMEPWTFSLRQLSYMVHKKLQLQWQQTASVMALIYNANRGSNSPSYSVYDFMPDNLIERENMSFEEFKAVLTEASKSKGRK